MKFTVSVQNLREAITAARPAVTPNATLPSRTAIYLEAVKGGKNPVRVTAAGEEAVIVAGVDEARVVTNGAAMLPPAPIGRWLGMLPGDRLLTVESTESAVRFTPEDAAPYSFHTLNGTFPTDPIPKAHVASLKLDAPLQEALHRVRKIVPKDMPMVHMMTKEGALVIDAADRSRLTRVTLPGCGFGDFSANMRLASMDRIAKIGPKALSWDTRAIRASGDTVTVTERYLADQEFPAVEGILNALPAQELKVDSDILLGALNRLSSVDPDAAASITFDAECIIIGLHEASVGAGQEQVPAEGDPSTDFTASVNLRYLTDAVAAHPGVDVTIRYSSPKSPLFFTSVTGTVDTTSVFMPLAM